MFTSDEVRAILYKNYTPEEICEILDISSYDLVGAFSFDVEVKQEEIAERIMEDLGYDTEDTEG